jgi:hypothetical protein
VTGGPIAATALSKLGDALSFSFGMFWEILWSLILGFALSGAVQAVVSKRQMRALLPDDSPRTLAVATGLGAASYRGPTPRWRSPALCFAGAPTSPHTPSACRRGRRLTRTGTRYGPSGR